MPFSITATQDTKLKLATGQSSELRDDQILAVAKGDRLAVLAHRIVNAHHTYCTFAQGYGPKALNSWYIYQPHWDGFPSGILTATFRPLGMQDEYGCELFNLELEMDGDLINIECGSGQPGHRPVPVEQDYPGSMNPLPQGRYQIGKPVYEALSNCDPAIGPVWLQLTPLASTNGRSGFLIHPDYNWVFAPGTAGCPFPIRNRDMYTIADWVRRSQSATLNVEYGF